MTKKKILAVIPARSGSKGLKNKNILKLKGKPLIQFTVDQVKKSKLIDVISISTDSIIIKKLAKTQNIWCDKLRPKKISGDKSKLFHAVKFVLDNIKFEPDLIVELHPTHVFRSTELIDQAIKIFLRKKNLDSLISVLEVKNTAHPDYVIKLKNNIIKYKHSPTSFNRHFLRKKYQSSGIILISTLKSFLKNKTMIGKKCYGFVVRNEIEKIDINNATDFEFCKFLMKK
jgi:CMP-N,N'-diacetyllegionaminic acid synthase